MAIRIVVTIFLMAAIACGWFSYDYYSKVPRTEQDLAAAREKLKTLPPGKSADREHAEVDVETLPPLIQSYRNSGQEYAIATGALLLGAFMIFMFGRKRVDPFDQQVGR